MDYQKNLKQAKNESVSASAQVIADKDTYNVNEIATESKLKLEDDIGQGEAAIIRMFEFGANPVAFKQHTPSKQELFNSHLKGIETMLWVDGMKIMSEVEPRLTISKNKKKYRIWVGARPQKGHILQEKPKTLSELHKGL